MCSRNVGVDLGARSPRLLGHWAALLQSRSNLILLTLQSPFAGPSSRATPSSSRLFPRPTPWPPTPRWPWLRPSLTWAMATRAAAWSLLMESRCCRRAASGCTSCAAPPAKRPSHGPPLNPFHGPLAPTLPPASASCPSRTAQVLRCGGIASNGFDQGSCLCEWQLAAADEIARALQQQAMEPSPFLIASLQNLFEPWLSVATPPPDADECRICYQVRRTPSAH